MDDCASTSFHNASCHQAENQYCHVRRIWYITLQLEFHTEILAPFASRRYGGIAHYKKQMRQHLACDHQELTLPFFPALEQWKTGNIELSEFWLDLSGLHPTNGTFINSVAYLDSHTVKVMPVGDKQAEAEDCASKREHGMEKGREFIKSSGLCSKKKGFSQCISTSSMCSYSVKSYFWVQEGE